MDINFHYFAVKTLARKAGFPEAEAQRIAEYSEYIDEFNLIKSVTAANIPEDIKTSTQYDMYEGGNTFNPVTTGFTSIIDYTILLKKSAQMFYIAPFHFISPSRDDRGNKEVVTRPATINDGSLISQGLVNARDIFIADQGAHPELCPKDLMRLGMLLHTFADSYAHQMFSGYDSWVNDVKKKQIIDNITGEDITEEGGVGNTETPSFYDGKSTAAVEGGTAETHSLHDGGLEVPFFSIGHGDIAHTPDLTNIRFTMLRHHVKGDKRKEEYTRSNTDEFLIVSREILDYLRSCLGKTAISDIEWTPFAANVRRGFLVKMPHFNVNRGLAAHWASVFTGDPTQDPDMVDIHYHFDASDIENRFGGKKGMYTDEFYSYNRLADEWLVNLYGDKPRQTAVSQ
jgi:hypothetical protein